jgi:hypothetical protein
MPNNVAVVDVRSIALPSARSPVSFRRILCRFPSRARAASVSAIRFWSSFNQAAFLLDNTTPSAAGSSRDIRESDSFDPIEFLFIPNAAFDLARRTRPFIGRSVRHNRRPHILRTIAARTHTHIERNVPAAQQQRDLYLFTNTDTSTRDKDRSYSFLGEATQLNVGEAIIPVHRLRSFR